LHDATEKGNIAVIRLLLSYGADPNIATYTGALPIDCTRDEKIRNFLKGNIFFFNSKLVCRRVPVSIELR